jgi:glycerophosphoryl diester phosphodiesterase
MKLLYKWTRIFWTLLTYPVAIAAGVPAAIAGMVWGFGDALVSRRDPIYGGRTGLARGFIRGFKGIFKGSTWLYTHTFLSRKEKDVLPTFHMRAHEMLIIGHRGAPYKHAENTLASLATALSEGANALEIDLCITRDGKVVLWHDWDPDSAVARYRESGLEACQRYRPFFPNGEDRRPVTDLSLAELRLRFGYARRDGSPIPAARASHGIPTFAEFMAWASNRKQLKVVFLDLKVPDDEVEMLAPMLADIEQQIKRYPPGFQIIFISPYEVILDRIRETHPEWEFCYDRVLFDAIPTATQAEARRFSAVKVAQDYGNQYAAVGRPTAFTLAPFEVYRSVVLEDLRYRHEQALETRIISWTINDPGEMRELIAMGVDGILTDYPHRLVQQVHRKDNQDVLRTARKWLGMSPQPESSHEDPAT